ncbi:MAG: hypothetical protein AAGJ35_05560, partial [Myxococcota bacterium]
SHTCAMLWDGTVKCWGENDKGQLGYSDTRNRNQPERQPLDFKGKRVLHLSSGYEHNCAILEDQTLRCWGENKHGQLGHQEKDPFALPLLEPPIPSSP